MPAHALVSDLDGPMQINTRTPNILGFQMMTATTTAAALPSIPGGATHALITVNTDNSIRYREDGTNPSATVGLLVQAGGAAELTNLSGVRIIATAGTVGVAISYRSYS